jgi:hypothetical protein
MKQPAEVHDWRASQVPVENFSDLPSAQVIIAGNDRLAD